jgi:hypothetical protein
MIVENVFCDRCNPQCARTARGWYAGPWSGAKEIGWRRYKAHPGHLCPTCLDEIDEQCRPTAEAQK